MAAEHKFNPSITALNDCLISCEVCATSCLQEQPAQMRDCIRASMDCAELCRATVTLLARGSKSVTSLCTVTAAACRQCAEHCEQHDYDFCEACAHACRRALEECEAIAA